MTRAGRQAVRGVDGDSAPGAAILPPALLGLLPHPTSSPSCRSAEDPGSSPAPPLVSTQCKVSQKLSCSAAINSVATPCPAQGYPKPGGLCPRASLRHWMTPARESPLPGVPCPHRLGAGDLSLRFCISQFPLDVPISTEALFPRAPRKPLHPCTF